MQESGSHAPMNKTQDKEYLFERMPVPGAVMQLSLPIVISSLVTILYNLADTFFVGMLNNPVENAAVTLVYPVTLAFNAVNNLFGVGVSSAMSHAFMDSTEIVDYGTRFLRVMSLGFVFLCTDFLTVGVFQALGMGRNALLFAICRKLVLEIPLLVLLNRLYPLYGLPFAQLITEVILCCMGVLMLRRTFRAEGPR